MWVVCLFMWVVCLFVWVVCLCGLFVCLLVCLFVWFVCLCGLFVWVVCSCGLFVLAFGRHVLYFLNNLKRKKHCNCRRSVGLCCLMILHLDTVLLAGLMQFVLLTISLLLSAPNNVQCTTITTRRPHYCRQGTQNISRLLRGTS